MKFQLWVDESGDFSQQDYTSLVGGILFNQNDWIDKKTAEDLWNKCKKNLGYEVPNHATSLNNKQLSEFAPLVLKELKNIGVNLVVFENEENILIADNDTTYIHILSEGIIQLVQQLFLENDYVELEVFIARRMADEGMRAMKEDEYQFRIQEKIDLGFSRRNIVRKKFKWSLKIKSAREDPRLFLSDLVCHTWYSCKKGKKFSNELKNELLNYIFEDKYYFTALENYTLSSIKRSISMGLYAEALYDIIFILNKNHLNKKKLSNIEISKFNQLLDDILKLIHLLPDYAQDEIFMNIINKLKTYVTLNRHSEKVTDILNFIKNTLIIKMSSNSFNHTLFSFHINLMLFTNATHMGNVKTAEVQKNTLQSLISVLANKWDNLDLLLDYLIRESVHDINTYNFHSVIQKMNDLEQFIEDLISLFSDSLTEKLSLNNTNMKSDKLGKVIGTRIQARLLLSREDNNQLKMAREDSEKAMSLFTEKSDLERQFQYRSNIECEDGNYLEAIDWIKKSAGLTPEASSISDLIKVLINTGSRPDFFGLMHFSRIFAYASFNISDKFLADQLFEEWTKQNITNLIKKNKENTHPFEIIFKNIGTYLFNNANYTSGIKYYNTAIEICGQNKHELTLQTIGLAIIAELNIQILSNPLNINRNNNSLNELIKKYRLFMKLDLPDSMRYYFDKWESYIAALDSQKNSEKKTILLKMAKSVGY